jgi:hypothetical protein
LGSGLVSFSAFFGESNKITNIAEKIIVITINAIKE